MPKFNKPKKRRSWTSKPSREGFNLTPATRRAAHLQLKNYLVTRRLRLARSTDKESMLEADTINQHLDYLRAIEKDE